MNKKKQAQRLQPHFSANSSAIHARKKGCEYGASLTVPMERENWGARALNMAISDHRAEKRWRAGTELGNQ